MADIESDLDQSAANQRRRDAEAELSKVKAALSWEKQRRKEAENELLDVKQQSDLFDSMGDPDPIAYQEVEAKATGQATAVLQIGDWHSEERIKPSTVNGLNDFDLKEADKRIKKTFENFVKLIDNERGLSKINDLVVAALGDFFTGHIHEECQEVTTLPPVKAVDWVEDRLAGGIQFLRKHGGFKTVTVVCCSGNHARITKKQRIATESGHSLEWLMYRHLEKFFRSDPSVVWKIEDSYHNYIRIQDKLCRFHHGHWIRYQGGIMGMGVPVEKAIAQWNKSIVADWDGFQHWHRHLRGERWGLGSSLCGFNPYSNYCKAPCLPPSQTALVFDRKRPLPVVVREVFCT